MHDTDTPTPATSAPSPPEKLAWIPPRLESMDVSAHTQGGGIADTSENVDSYS